MIWIAFIGPWRFYITLTVWPANSDLLIQVRAPSGPEHHRKSGFVEELRKILDLHGVKYEEKYIQ